MLWLRCCFSPPVPSAPGAAIRSSARSHQCKEVAAEDSSPFDDSATNNHLDHRDDGTSSASCNRPTDDKFCELTLDTPLAQEIQDMIIIKGGGRQSRSTVCKVRLEERRAYIRI